MVTVLDEQRVVQAVPKELFIGGQWRSATGNGQLHVEDPATTTQLGVVADASPADGQAAVEAAVKVQPSWAAVAPRERGEILRRAWQRLVDQQEDLALLMTLEMGKPIAESRAEINYAAEFFRWFSEEAVRIDGSYSLAPDGKSRLLVMRQPVGPCLFITPWNFPMAMAARKIGPAIAAGCTMVIKPASQTPLSMLALAQILAEVGLPNGVLNVITTSRTQEVIEPLIRGGLIRKLSFTGSTAVGRQLLTQASDQILRVSLELGGNAPFIVFGDADLDAAVQGALTAKMRNIGEACTAANRFYVDRAVAAEFTDRLVAAMGQLRIGRGVAEDVQVGPLIDARARNKVSALVEDATDSGAKVRLGGHVVEGDGYFYPPTVLADVPSSARLAREEIFGPVAPISVFDTEEQAIAAANATEYGLVSYVYTNDLARAFRVCERIESGMIGLNQGIVSNPAAPFGGVKHSGFGREGGRAGIEEYLELKYLAFPAF